MPWDDFFTIIAQLAIMFVFAFIVLAVVVGVRESIRKRDK